MAIGKVNAYATVEGPKVDFGEIALNAQKIQQADLDRMKDMIPKAEKEKEIKPLSIDEKTSTLGTFEHTAYKVAESARDGYYQSMKSGDPVTASRFETVIKRLNGSKEIIKSGSDSFLKDFSENKISGIESAKIETINNFRDRRNATGGVSENGTLYMQIFDKDESGDILMQDGKPVLKKIRVGDKLVDEITEDQLPSYLVDYVPANDILEESKKFAANTGANKTSVENGNVTVAKTEYTKENLDLLKDSISSKLRSNRKYFEDVWYQSNPSKNNSRKMPSEYTEEDYKEAENFLYDQTRRNFDSSYTKSVDEPTKITINNGKEGEATYTTPRVSEIIQNFKNGKKRAVGYNLSVNQNSDDLFIGSTKARIEGIGYDNLNKRFYISYYGKVNESEKTDGGSESKTSTQKKFIYLNGEGADTSLANTVIPKLSYRDKNGNLVRYQDVSEVIDAVKSADPKGKYFGNVQSNTNGNVR